MSVEISNIETVEILDSYQLTPEERDQFDFVNWGAVEAGEANPEFFRYRSTLYYLESEGRPEWAPEWEMHLSDTFFSGIVMRYLKDDDECIDGETLEIGMYYAS